MGVYENPVIRGFNPDPSLVRVGTDFFLVTSTFEYFPGIPIYHSKDLLHWELIGHALTRRSQLDIKTPDIGGGTWAPTIRWREGVFYVTAACFDRYRPQSNDRVWPRGFYVKTESIWVSDSWSDPVYFDQVGFDQDLFWDDEGTVYLSTTYRKLTRTPGLELKDFAVHVCTVDLETGNSTSAPQLIRESLAGSGVAEGSHIFKRGRYYYLFTAEGGTESGHCEHVSRSSNSPFGPWELGAKNPLWRNGPDDEVQNTGHADLVEDADGRWWAVFLGVRPRRTGQGWEPSLFGRETFLVPVTWDADDWPVVNGGQKVMLQGSGPGLRRVEHPARWRDDFSTQQLQLGWYRKNTPVKDDVSLTERAGYLRLHGSAYTLSTAACPTLLLRKQTHEPATWETTLEFQPDSPRTEAGAVVYWNHTTYSSIGIRAAGDGRGRVVRLRPAEGAVVEAPLASADAAVVLTIRASGDGFEFGFGEGAGPPAWLGAVSRRAMTREPAVGAAFTGMMFGLFAFGELERCLAPADFGYAALVAGE